MRTLRVLALFSLTAVPLVAQATPVLPRETPAPSAPATPPAPAQIGYGAWFGSRPSMDDRGDGVLVDDITAGSPAQKAGIKAGDVITKMGPTAVADLGAMTAVLRAHRPGDTLDVVVVRGTEKKTFRVVLGVRP